MPSNLDQSFFLLKKLDPCMVVDYGWSNAFLGCVCAFCRLYTAPECHQTQTFGVCMNEVNSHMRRTKRRLLPFRRVQSTDARPCHMHAPINIRGLFRFLLRVVPSGWLANYCSRTKLTLLTHAVVPLRATSHMIRQKVPPLELLWGPVLPPITMVVYIVGGKKLTKLGLYQLTSSGGTRHAHSSTRSLLFKAVPWYSQRAV